MTKKERHIKADQFRSQIALPTQRAVAINGLMAKEKYDEVDELRISMLLKKTSLIEGCEQPYRDFLVHLSKMPAYQKQALEFYRRWHG